MRGLYVILMVIGAASIWASVETQGTLHSIVWAVIALVAFGVASYNAIRDWIKLRKSQ